MDPAGIYLLKVNNIDTRKTPTAYIVNFEHVIAGWGKTSIFYLTAFREKNKYTLIASNVYLTRLIHAQS